MRRLLGLLAALCLLTGCTATADERTGQAEGYGGVLRVRIALEGDRLTRVEVIEHHETEGVGTRAIDALPKAMVAAGSPEVDGVAGATVTSQAMLAAVRDAMGVSAPASDPSPAPDPLAGLLPGVGMRSLGRIGPGTDDTGAQVYSFNVVFAAGLFAEDGRIEQLQVDQLEVVTPNVKGAVAVFGGFPGQGGFAQWDDKQGKVAGTTEDTEEAFLAQVSAWKSKGAQGSGYKLTSGTWREEMDAYQRFFRGKTVQEVEEWFQTYCSDTTGRPLTSISTSEEDQSKYDALSEADKAMLADVTASATISLRDAHGDILSAIRAAWEDAKQRAKE